MAGSNIGITLLPICYCSLLVVHCNHVSIWHYFCDIASYRKKIRVT